MTATISAPNQMFPITLLLFLVIKVVLIICCLLQETCFQSAIPPRRKHAIKLLIIPFIIGSKQLLLITLTTRLRVCGCWLAPNCISDKPRGALRLKSELIFFFCSLEGCETSAPLPDQSLSRNSLINSVVGVAAAD